MKEQKQYFFIDLEHLGDSQLFPFHLHIYNPANGVYNPYLYANSPLTSAKKELLADIMSKGGKLAIPMKQKRTFLVEAEVKEEDIPDLAPNVVHSLEKRRQELLEKNTINTNSVNEVSKNNSSPSEKTGNFHFKEQLAGAAKNDDFTPLINFVREEVVTFSPRISAMTTMSSLLAESLLVEDNFTNRTVALSFLLAKGCGITDPAALGDLVCAGYFFHLGYTQLPHTCMNKPQIQYIESTKKEWKKHPGLSLHILRKAQIDLSPQVKTIIEQHHERYDGQGFPQMKKGSHIEPLALVLGATSHILEYTSGRVSGTPTTLPSFILNLKNKTYLPGMEVEFGDLIQESLAHLVDTMNSSDENKKVA